MATTQNLYTGNGATVLYSFTFPYIDVAHIKVTLDGVATTAYTLANATTVQFNAAPANGVIIRIYRDTAIEAPEAVFYKGSTIRANDLNDNFTQELYKAQEDVQYAVTTDGKNPFIGPPDLGGFRITNVGTPTAGTDAVTKSWVETAGASPLVQFRSIYYGAYASDPGVDPYGAARTEGDLYYNSTLSQMRVFNGTTWQEASADATITRFRFTAVGGETSLSGEDDDSQSLTYNVGLELVYLNGALLARGIDYTATNGSSITGLVALTASDFVEIIALSQINAVGSIPSANSTFLQSGSGAVTRTVDSKLKDVVSVKDFGAVGNGVADDTAAIQAAIDSMSAGSSLYFPDGTYLVTGIQLSGTLQNKTGLSFISKSAVIKLANGTTNKNTAEVVSGSDYLISGLTFKGNKGTVTPPGTDLSYRHFNCLYVGAEAGKTLSNVKIEYCSFNDAPYCGLMAGSGPVDPGNILPGIDSLSVNGCSFTGNEVGVAGGAQRNATYTGNTFTDNDIYGLLVDVDSRSVSVTGNSIDHLSVDGAINACLYAYNSDYVSFTGNVCHGGKIGVFVDTGANFCNVSGNTCYAQTINGIRVINSTHTTVSGNTVKNVGQAGIYFGTSSTQCTVIGNVVDGSGYDNIICDAISGVSLTGNVLTGANGSGLLFSSCTWMSASNNTCLNNNRNNGDSVSSGIRLSSTTASRIIDNFCTDSQGVKTQNYGIREEGTADANYYAGNYLAGNKTANRSLIGATNVFIGHPGSEAIINVPGGSAAAPGLSFINSPTSGLYRASSDDVGVTANGAVATMLRSVSGAVNYPVIRSGSTANIDIFPEGTAADINTNISCKGSGGSVVLRSGNNAAVVTATQGGVGFQGAAAIAKPTVTGSRGANAALASLLTALANYGLITDSTT